MISAGRTPLVICPKQLGDILLLQPMLAAMRERSRGPVALLTRSGHRPMLKLMPEVRVPHRAVAGVYSSIVGIGDNRKTTVSALLNFSRRKILILPAKAERSRWQKLVFGSVHADELGDEFVGRFYWKWFAERDARFRAPRLEQPPEGWAPPGVSPGGYLLLNATSGWKRKSWKPDRWAQVADALGGVYDCEVLLTSGTQKWQREAVEKTVAAAGGRCRPLAGGTSLEQFLWLCANARMVLTVDGAAAHFAQAFRVPAVTLFGPTHAGNWHFSDASHRAVVSKSGAARMEDIAPDSVIETALSIVAPSSGR